MTINVGIRKSKGFTLIEILVSSIILFSTISLISIVYKSALLNSMKASDHVFTNSISPLIISEIKKRLANSTDRKFEFSGDEDGIKFHSRSFVEAEEIRRKSASESLLVERKRQYRLWKTELLIEYGSASKSIIFYSLIWYEV